MSSLITAASPWTTDENISKKRISTIKKPKQIRPMEASAADYMEYNSDARMDYAYPTVDNDQAQNSERNQRVLDIIHRMSNVQSENDGSKLADFTPPPRPEVKMREDAPQVGSYTAPAGAPTYGAGKIDMLPSMENPLQHPPHVISNAGSGYVYSPLGNQTRNFNNYSDSYTGKMTELKAPYYATQMGLGAGNSNDKMMEKLNYMIHMLENLEHEKTANVTEEFILYTFLGVFVIFVLDSFSKNGKYVR
jgi:hypothetical protein